MRTSARTGNGWAASVARRAARSGGLPRASSISRATGMLVAKAAGLVGTEISIAASLLHAATGLTRPSKSDHVSRAVRLTSSSPEVGFGPVRISFQLEKL